MRYPKWALVFLCVTACSGAPERAEPKPAAEPQASADSKCLGDRVPPTGWMQATAFRPITTPNAADAARNEALKALRDRICQGYRCSEIAPKITLWNTQADNLQVCAMAVVKSADIAAFRELPRKELSTNLDASALALVKYVGKDQVKIAIDNVRDNGVDGGARAEWLIDRMNASLSKTGARVAKLPPEWTGLNLPEGIDGVLRGRITRMHGRESMLEITWTLDLGDAFSSVDPVTFPEFIGPNVDDSTRLAELPGDSRDLSLRFDARPGGGLCNGQEFKMNLETSKALHVRVLNLYGDDALMIYRSTGPVKKGTPEALGNYMAVKANGIPPAERFIAIGAANVVDLEEYGAAKTIPCRIPRPVAVKLHQGKGLPGRASKTSRGFRILEGDDCQGFAPPTAADTALIASIPMCW